MNGSSAPNPVVRLARPEDEEEIMEMCRRLHDENGLFSFDENLVRGCLERYYQRKGSIVGVIGDTGKIEASICIMFAGMYYTKDQHLAELWNYVDPRYRRSRNAYALIEFSKRCSDEIGLPLIIGIITNHRLAEKVRLYRRVLGQPAGAWFCYGATWANESHPDVEFWREPFPPRRANGGKELALKD